MFIITKYCLLFNLFVILYHLLGEIWANKTSLTPQLFFMLNCLSQARKVSGWSYICVFVCWVYSFASIYDFSLKCWNCLDSVVFSVFHLTILALITSVVLYISQIFSYSARNTKYYIYLYSVVQHHFFLFFL